MRIVAATHPDLHARIADGRFRRDLYARLSLAEVHVPPLRDRRGDVPDWVARFDARWIADEGGAPLRFTADAMEALLLAPWPENLRGVDRTVYRLRCLLLDRAVEASDVELLPPGAHDVVEADEAPGLRDKPTKEELACVLAENDGSVRATAKHFSRDRRQIYRWMQAYGLR